LRPADAISPEQTPDAMLNRRIGFFMIGFSRISETASAQA